MPLKDEKSIGTSSTKERWELNQDDFDGLLKWLHEDREQSALKYEELRRRLIKIFTCRGCPVAEELADETINRVCKKVKEIAPTYEGEPALYFYGVANKVHLEYVRKSHVANIVTVPPAIVTSDDIEHKYQCLEKCIRQLDPQNRDLVVQYYQDDKRAKINHRKELAERLNIALNALRIRAHRIRASLYKCMVDCLARQTAE